MSLGDSGTFGPAQRNVPNSLYKPKKRKANSNVKNQLTGKLRTPGNTLLDRAMKGIKYGA